MKKLLIILVCFCVFIDKGNTQETNPVLEQQLENFSDSQESETEDDSYMQQLDFLKKNPLDLNMATEPDLITLRFLSGLQIQHFLLYRKLVGNLINIYELQAIPAWDIETIKAIFPYIKIGNTQSVKETFQKRLKQGEHSFLFRYSQVVQKAKGYDLSTSGTKYAGSRDKLFFRYRYNYKNLLQYGVAGDKDAGEQFFKGAQKQGFDFYSFHFFARKIGKIESIALGDFTVNMGQGLIQWQSLAFGKSVDIVNIKRQSPVLRPYNSAGEFNFHRGAGVTLKNGKWETTAFASYRKLSANYVADTINREDYVSSLLNSGFHRTPSEIADRNNLQQIAFGGNIKYKTERFLIGVNAIHYNFSLPLQKKGEPYNLYAIAGNTWMNISTDYSYTFKNMHFFGEAAIDKRKHPAFINGLLISVDPKVDLSFLQRTISKGYQSINGNAFTENTYPTNETGLFSGISIRPAAGWRIDGYADIFSFPWLRYQDDAPGSGKDFMLQLTYAPNRQFEIYTRLKQETKDYNLPGNNTATNIPVSIPRQSWRIQTIYSLNREFTIRNRIEMLWYDKKGALNENGFLGFADLIYKPYLKPFSANIRLQYFETGGYNSRLYAYENDVLYYYAIPAFFDKGFRYYFNFNYDLSKKLSFWVKWSSSTFDNKAVTGSGLDEINTNNRSDIRLQIRLMF